MRALAPADNCGACSGKRRGRRNASRRMERGKTQVAAKGNGRDKEANGATMFDGLITCRRLLAMLVVAAPMLAHTAHAQQVVVMVNGDPLTPLDIEQPSKLTQMSAHKVHPPQEAIQKLISEHPPVKEA